MADLLEETTPNFLTSSEVADFFTLAEESSLSVSVASVSGTRQFRIYGTIAAEILGIIFNLLTMAVFMRTPLRQSGLYLFALAIADTLALLVEIIRWFSSGMYMGLHWMDESLILCKVTNHIRYGSRLWSAFLTATITVERYFAVAHPLRVVRILTRKSTKIIITVELLASICLSVYASILFELIPTGGHSGCSISTENSFYYARCNWIISKAVGEVTTSLVVLLFTCHIIRELIRARAFRRRHTAEKDIQNKVPTVDLQLTFMLVLVASAFFFLRAPYTITYYLSHNRMTVFSGNTEYLKLVRYRLRQSFDVTFFLYTLNHSINFFLYSLSGSKFRGYLALLFCKQRTQNKTVLSKTEMLSVTSRSVSAGENPVSTEKIVRDTMAF